MKAKTSLLLKVSTVVFSILGIVLSMISAGADGYSHPAKRLTYFTGLSNIWIGVLMAVILANMFFAKQCNREKIKDALYVLKYIFTVSITLTAFIFCVVLAPGSKNGNYNAWTLSNIITHVVVPFFAIVDFVIDEYKIRIKSTHLLCTTIPPLLYLIFASVLGSMGFVFRNGETYPYFFLNFNSPAGFFGFSDVMHYIMGSFWWILFILAIILSLAFAYMKLNNINIIQNYYNKSIQREKER